MAAGAYETELGQVARYWEGEVAAWKIARHEPGTLEFFKETEDYRFNKLHYLSRRVGFADYEGQRVLEVGCGIANDLSRFARGGAAVTGVDLTERAIELARRNFELRGLEGDFQVMNGEAMSFPDDSFDVVYCHTVLQFTPRPARMIEEISRVLRPGGTAVLMMVNRRSWLYTMQKLAHVEIDHLDAPVYTTLTIAEFSKLLTPVFAETQIVAERFPVRTEIHGGLKGILFNTGFVGSFNALPKRWTRQFGHHLLAFARKAERSGL